MDKKIDEMIWKDFEKSGNAGTYLLYNALTKQKRKNNSTEIWNEPRE